MSASSRSYWSNTISTVFGTLSEDVDDDDTDDSDDLDDVDNPPPLTGLHQVRIIKILSWLYIGEGRDLFRLIIRGWGV